MFVSMAEINIKMTAMENVVFVYFVFYLLLKCDPIEETVVADRKCVDKQIGTDFSILKLYSTNF